jgi:pimeloyl-ACP methyl ester carboxylesterase
VRTRQISANGLRFGILEAGAGPLALCLHGFPDSAYTWRHLLPALADAGFHAVAPFMRGYAPTEVPADGCYGKWARAADAVALHDALGGGPDAVLIGHDWGAETAYAAAALDPERWRTLVGLSIPPPPVDLSLFGDYDQLKRFFYIFAFQAPVAEALVAADEFAFLDRLWADWSPSYDATEDLRHAKECLQAPQNLSAALNYYRAIRGVGSISPCERCRGIEAGAVGPAPQPTLYVHGSEDGCVGVELVRDAPAHLAPGSRMWVVRGAGHFLHLEAPRAAADRILAWLAA